VRVRVYTRTHAMHANGGIQWLLSRVLNVFLTHAHMQRTHHYAKAVTFDTVVGLL
jgi:hypothetical protein